MPGSDAELPAFFRDLGIPGAVDVHIHFMPEAILRKVWAYFDAVGRWPVRYRYDEPTRLATLRELGVVAHQIEALARLDLGDDWLRAVLHDNGVRLLARS